LHLKSIDLFLTFLSKRKPFIPYTGTLLHSGTWAPIVLSVRNLLVRQKRREKTKLNARNSQKSPRGGAASHRRRLLSSCAPFIPTSPADPVPAVHTRCPTSPRTPRFHRSEARSLVPARRSPPLSSLRRSSPSPSSSRLCAVGRVDIPLCLESIPLPAGEESISIFLVLLHRIPPSPLLRPIKLKSFSPQKSISLVCSSTEPQKSNPNAGLAAARFCEMLRSVGGCLPPLSVCAIRVTDMLPLLI
jgi:hypothetical protein